MALRGLGTGHGTELASGFISLSVKYGSAMAAIKKDLENVQSEATKAGDAAGASHATAFTKAASTKLKGDKQVRDALYEMLVRGGRTQEAALEWANQTANQMATHLKSAQNINKVQQSLNYIEAHGNSTGKAWVSNFFKELESGNTHSRAERIGGAIGYAIGRPINLGIRGAVGGFRELEKAGKRALGMIGEEMLKTTGKMTALGGSLTVIAGTAGGFMKGFEQVEAVEKAEAALQSLGMTTEQIDDVMNRTKQSLHGTMYGLQETIGTASKAVQSGLQGDQLTAWLNRVESVASLTGKSIDQTGTMFLRWQDEWKTSSMDLRRMSREDFPQLANWLQQTLHVGPDQLADMMKQGLVTIDDIYKTIDEHTHGMAQKMRHTLSGELHTMGAQVGNIFANLMTGIGGGQPGADGLEKVNQRLEHWADVLASPQGVKNLQSIGHAFGNIWHAVTNVWHAASNTWHAVTNFWHAMENAWHAVTNFWHAMENTWHAVTNVWHACENIWHAVTNVWHAWTNVWHAISNVWNFITMGEGHWHNWLTTIEGIWHFIESIWHGGEHVVDWVDHVWHTCEGPLGHAMDNIDHAVSNIEHAWDNVWHAGENFAHACENVWHALEKAWDFVQKIWDKFAHSPVGNAIAGIGDFLSHIPGFAQGAIIQQPVGPGGLIRWAEPETGGEAYIPLGSSNRKRSVDIWAETGKRLGVFAQGGIVTNIMNYATGGIATSGADSRPSTSGILQVIWSNTATGQKVGEAGGSLVGPGTSQPGYYSADWGGHTGHVHTSFATGPNGQFYGLPKGTDIRQGKAGFPAWVYALGNRFGLEPSTYAGHQEASGFNRGIDWWPKGHADMSGKSYTPQERARLDAFAKYLASASTSGAWGRLSGMAAVPGMMSVSAVASSLSSNPYVRALQAWRGRTLMQGPAYGGDTGDGTGGDPIVSAIVAEGLRRGYSPEAIAWIVADAQGESGLNPANKDHVTGTHWGLFQQDSSYPGRTTTEGQIQGFYDRLASTPGGNIGEKIVNLERGGYGPDWIQQFLPAVVPKVQAALSGMSGGMPGASPMDYTTPGIGGGVDDYGVPLSPITGKQREADEKRLKKLQEKLGDLQTRLQIAQERQGEVSSVKPGGGSKQSSIDSAQAKLDKINQQLDLARHGSNQEAINDLVQKQAQAQEHLNTLLGVGGGKQPKKSAIDSANASVAKLNQEIQDTQQEIGELQQTISGSPTKMPGGKRGKGGTFLGGLDVSGLGDIVSKGLIESFLPPGFTDYTQNPYVRSAGAGLNYFGGLLKMLGAGITGQGGQVVSSGLEMLGYGSPASAPGQPGLDLVEPGSGGLPLPSPGSLPGVANLGGNNGISVNQGNINLQGANIGVNPTPFTEQLKTWGTNAKRSTTLPREITH